MGAVLMSLIETIEHCKFVNRFDQYHSTTGSGMKLPAAGRRGRPVTRAVFSGNRSNLHHIDQIVDLQEYRRGVGICLVNRQSGQVFCAQRADDTQATWQLPQGGIDRLPTGYYENPREAALRELFEETGVQTAEIIASLDPWLHYDHPTLVGCLRYRGQTQKWFLLVADADTVQQEVDLTTCGELRDWAWRSLEDLPSLTVSFKRRMYEEVVLGFGPKVAQLVLESVQRD